MATTKRTRYKVVPDIVDSLNRGALEMRDAPIVYDPDEDVLYFFGNDDWIKLLNNSGGLIMVSSLSDLPDAVNDVITLEPNVNYFITTSIDLNGARLVGSSNTTIIGGSSETSVITSTGLNASTALFTTQYTTPIRHISFKDVGTALSIDGQTTSALDWTGVNFVNIPNIGIVQNADNFIFTKGAFLNSKGLTFTGTIGTIAISDSLLSGDGTLGNIVEVDSLAVITRRFRIIYSSIIAFGSTVGLNVSTSADIINQSYILDTVNFGGNGTYLQGIQADNNKALFTNVSNIDNSADICQYSMRNNAVATNVTTAGAVYKILGTTTNSSVTQKFTHTNNRATYVGALNRFFKVSATLSVISGNNNLIGIYIAKNGSVLPDSEVYITTNASGNAEGASVQVLTQLIENDFIEIWVENDSSTSNITVSFLNVIIE